MKRRLTNLERISSKSDIHQLLNNKTKYYSRCLGITAVSNSANIVRLFVCVRNARSMKAVERNRYKRLGRELFRNNKLLLPSGCDIGIFIAPHAHGATFDKLQQEYRALLLKLKGVEYGEKNNRCGNNIDHNNSCWLHHTERIINQ